METYKYKIKSVRPNKSVLTTFVTSVNLTDALDSEIEYAVQWDREFDLMEVIRED